MPGIVISSIEDLMVDWKTLTYTEPAWLVPRDDLTERSDTPISSSPDFFDFIEGLELYYGYGDIAVDF